MATGVMEVGQRTFRQYQQIYANIQIGRTQVSKKQLHRTFERLVTGVINGIKNRNKRVSKLCSLLFVLCFKYCVLPALAL